LFPAPFTMCFSAECKERQDEHQVSIFEATADTFTLLPTQRILDSQLAVAKYRRSTATRKRPPRSLFQILATWNHLLQVVFVDQKTFENMPRQSLLTTSAFCDDRIRALQVDLVLSQENSAELQFQLIKYHFVNMYLLSEKMTSTKCWEPKFARRALWTALTAFWNNTHDANYKDEVLCLTALCQLATRVVQDEEYCKNVVLAWQDAGSSHTSTSYGNILLLANHCVENGKYPKFLHALRIVSTCMLEMYQTTLQMICDDLPFEEEFNVVCRICMAPALTMLRLGALRHYNKAFGKFEHVCGKEMARLLHLPSSTAALDFCKAVGLPIEKDSVVMKAAPVSKPADQSALAWSRQEDNLVFGSLRNAMNRDCRVDEDGIRIPSPMLLKNLICSNM